MEIGEEYTTKPGQKYHVLKRIAQTSGANIFTVRSLNERGKPIRVIKSFKRHDRLAAIELEREIDVLTRLNQSNSGEDYPGVIKLLDHSKDELFLIMEYMRGGDLNDSINYKGIGNFHLAEAVTIIRQLSGTLAKMFRNEGIVHRDVKPDNILLSESASGCLRDNREQNRNLEELAQTGEIKFCDFSLSLTHNRDTGEYESDVHQETEEGYFIGSLKYCAPEITGSKDGVNKKGDEKSDIWSLGVIAYDLLVRGSAFFDAKSTIEVLSKIATFDSPREIKRDLHGFEEVVYGMLQKHPKDRITAEEIHRIALEFEEKLKDGELSKTKTKSLLRRILRLPYSSMLKNLLKILMKLFILLCMLFIIILIRRMKERR